KVHGHAGRAVAIRCGDRVRDSIWPNLARIVVPDRNARLHPRTELEQLRVRVALRELVVRADQLGDGGRQADPVDTLEVEEALVERAELVATLVALRRDAPVLRQVGALEQTQEG